jgi:hypothetical protein
MSLMRDFRPLLLVEFISAFGLAMRYFFKPKPTLNYPFERTRSLLDFEASMPCGGIPTVRNAASHVSCVKLSAQPRRSQLKQGLGGTTGRGALFVMTSIW